jgi:uncharacterized protein YcbK (DUF882 family)
MAALFLCPLRAGCSLSLAALLVVFGCRSLQTAAADGETRSLTMHHTHTGEDITVTFKRNGRYDDAALQKLNWFLRDWRRDVSTKMDPHLFDVVWEVYHELDAKAPINIISAYRSPETNSMLRHRGRGVAQYSQHMVGHAMDFFIPGVPLEQIRSAGLRLQRGGVGFYPTSGSPFVHLDTGSVRHWPRMTHDQLARVFPDGKTVHVPSDGKPLKGYAVALAEVERRGGSPNAVSLNAAREAGAISDNAGSTGSKHNLLARLFGFGKDEEEEETGSPATTRAARPAESAKPAVAIAGAVPVPVARPGRAAEPATRFDLASAESRPVNPPSAPSSAAEVLEQRGTWPGAAGDPGGSGQRYVWTTGPAGRTAELDPPRPPAPIGVASAPPIAVASAAPEVDITASVSPFPSPRRDHLPTLALAYAAPVGPEPALRPAPMGALKSALTAAPGRAVPRDAVRSSEPATTVVQRAGLRGGDPWLRGVVLSPSVHFSMSVAMFGPPDYQLLAGLMRKPPSVVASAFCDDPHSGMTSEYFAGAAIAFVPTVTFGTRTAGLN